MRLSGFNGIGRLFGITDVSGRCFVIRVIVFFLEGGRKYIYCILGLISGWKMEVNILMEVIFL